MNGSIYLRVDKTSAEKAVHRTFDKAAEIEVWNLA